MFARAVGLHQEDRAAEAEAAYRSLLHAFPTCAPALNNLGLLVGGDRSVLLFQCAVAAEPHYVDALLNLSGALHRRNDLAGAAVSYQRALALIPEAEEPLCILAGVLQQQGRNDEAVCQCERVLALNPANLTALFNLATLHTSANRLEAATHCLRQAIRIDPESDVLRHNLVLLLKEQGQLQEAAAHGQRFARPRKLEYQTAACPRRTVLVADGMVGNVPWKKLMPPDTTVIVWQVEYSTDGQERDLPDYDVAFNAVGDADVMDESYARLAGFHRRRPMLNDPAAVANTRRDKMPDLLRGIAGAVVPAVMRVERAELTKPGLLDRMAEAGIGFPVLVRPIGGHGGLGVQRVGSPAELERTAFGDADAHYFTAYHDYQSADGYYRKYRMTFVDGVPYPYHLAISPTWLVHYFSADMLAAPWKREEEKRFLENPGAVLSAATMATIQDIATRMGLDYGGMDFSVLPDGRVLVFEANATMLAYWNDSTAEFAYKHVGVRAITQAFAAMLDRHAEASSR